MLFATVTIEMIGFFLLLLIGGSIWAVFMTIVNIGSAAVNVVESVASGVKSIASSETVNEAGEAFAEGYWEGLKEWLFGDDDQ